MTTPFNINEPGAAEKIAQLLESVPGYRILRQFDPESMFSFRDMPQSENVGLGLALDTETTGKDDSENDKIIEIGLVTFAYDRNTGQVLRALERYNALEDPGFPIPPEASAINNITDEMVSGQRIDDKAVESLAELADFVVAHHSGFDRPFCEKRFPIFKEKAWGCSLHQIDWSKSPSPGAKLEVLALTQGFYYSAHRAETDCLAMLRVLNTALPGMSHDTPLQELLGKLHVPSHRIWAVAAPFDAKDLLRIRGYKWSDGSKPGFEKAWNIEVSDENLAEELAWLKQTVFRGKSVVVPVDTVDATIRFSSRRGKTNRITL